MPVKHEDEQGVPQDYAEAIGWYRKAADQGDVDAQFSLGLIYAHGQGVPQDYAEAIGWYRKAAEQGNADAQFNLGLIFATGQGVPQDYAEAIGWCRKAAEQGKADAQFLIGVAYANGQGVPQDYAEAIGWCRKAADQGKADAQFNLGAAYANGQGVPQDYAEAIGWYRKAAEQGKADAQFNLGLMYSNGQGVPQDYVQGHRWLSLAAAQNDAHSSTRDAIADAIALKLTSNTKPCPSCAEQILAAAVKCRYCGEFLPGSAHQLRNVAIIGLLIPGGGHVYSSRFIAGALWALAAVLGYWASFPLGVVVHLASLLHAARMANKWFVRLWQSLLWLAVLGVLWGLTTLLGNIAENNGAAAWEWIGNRSKEIVGLIAVGFFWWIVLVFVRNYRKGSTWGD